MEKTLKNSRIWGSADQNREGNEEGGGGVVPGKGLRRGAVQFSGGKLVTAAKSTSTERHSTYCHAVER